MNADYQIDDARVVGREYQVTLAMLVEYEFPVVAGHEPDSALEVAEDLARFSNLEKTQPVERDTIHTETDVLRDIYEDDVEAGELEWMDEPTAPSPDTYWDDTRHFGDGDREVRTDGGQSSSGTERVNPTELGALIYEKFDVSTLEAKNIAERGVDSNWQIHTETERTD